MDILLPLYAFLKYSAHVSSGQSVNPAAALESDHLPRLPPLRAILIVFTINNKCSIISRTPSIALLMEIFTSWQN